jgi:hypothetical protein
MVARLVLLRKRSSKLTRFMLPVWQMAVQLAKTHQVGVMAQQGDSTWLICAILSAIKFARWLENQSKY